MAEALKEEKAAIDDSIKAATELAAAKHAEAMAILKEKNAAARAIADIKAKEAASKEAAIAEEARKADEAARIKEDKTRKEAEDKAREAHAAAVELHMEK
jgi:hypothetical protein